MPIYMTGTQQKHQQVIAERVKMAWGWQCEPAPVLEHATFAIHKAGRCAAFMTTRTRTNTANKYPSVFLDLAKVQYMLQLERTKKVPSFFFAQFTDCLMFAPLDNLIFRARIGGRYDRGDERDVEPIADIPVAALFNVEGTPDPLDHLIIHHRFMLMTVSGPHSTP